MTLTSVTSLPVAQFKGRGHFRLLHKQALEQQTNLHIEMDALVERSKVRGSPLYLQRHKKTSGAWMLRWRLVHAGAHKHVVWSGIQPFMESLPMAVRKHCAGINQRATELNTLDIIFEHTAKWCAHFLEDGLAHGAERVSQNPRAT